jgi:phage portal protein BeeE
MDGALTTRVRRLRRSRPAVAVAAPSNEMQTRPERDISSARIIYTGRTKSGIRITPDNAVTISAVWACIRFLSQSIASLPWSVIDDASKRPVSLSVPA